MATLAKLVAFSSLAAVTACGTGLAAEDRPCTAIGSREGVSLDIKAPYAAKVASASMRICWNGTCRTSTVELMGSSTTVPQGCTGDAPDDSCGAVASPTGDKNGFAEVTGIPKSPVQVTVDLRDASGERLLSKRLDVTPRATFPNGPECGEGRPQTGIVVAADAGVTERR
ncbi:hypothetical protein ACGFNU_10485 [Spirillospora sp. NPDC048911]|uniref:hypothetical protein n=1 Tax=Spirillospora sp. NPDC048911 TaxID=3364527 RepID=UPI0037203C23